MSFKLHHSGCTYFKKFKTFLIKLCKHKLFGKINIVLLFTILMVIFMTSFTVFYKPDRNKRTNASVLQPEPTPALKWEDFNKNGIPDPGEPIYFQAPQPPSVQTAPLHTTAPISDPTTSWSMVPSQNSSVQNSISGLSSVSALSDTDAWTVGVYWYNNYNNSHQIIEHWDGNQWTLDNSQGSTDTYSYLSGVSMLSSSEAFAVGQSGTSNNPYFPGTHPLVEEYLNGAWTVVPIPLVNAVNGFLTSVTAVSSSDIWAVGYNIDTDSELIVRKHGSIWEVVTPPARTSHGGILNSVAALSASDIWAFGTSDKYGRQGHAIADHWNGTVWTPEDPPVQTNGTGTVFYTASAIPSTGTVWASGQTYLENSTTSPLLANIVNGAWNYVTVTPAPGQCINYTGASCSYNVAATENEVDLVPVDLNINKLAERLVNGNWQTVPVEIPTNGLFPGGYLSGITGVPGENKFWTVGQTNGGTTLIEQYTPSTAPTLPSGFSLTDTGKSILGANTQNAAKSNEPINLALGNYFFQRIDLSIAGRGLPFVFQRTYNSLDTYNGPLGFGWTDSYNILQTTNADNSITIKYGDGHSITFQPQTDGSYKPTVQGIYDRLTKQASGVFLLTTKPRVQYQFNGFGQPDTITDPNGNRISLQYNSQKRLASVTDTAGRMVQFNYDAGGHMTTITDPIGRKVAFSYDDQGNLKSSTDAEGNTTEYTYNSFHQVETITDPKGQKIITNSYDGTGRVNRQTNGRDLVWQYAYDVGQSGNTVETNPKGKTTSYLHDDKDRLIKQTDPLGKFISFDYDGNNNLTSLTDKNGNTYTFSYDNEGNLLKAADPLGNTTRLVYSNLNLPTQETDAKGNSTQLTYDTNGNLVSVVNALSSQTSLQYDSHGEVIKVTDAKGGLLQFAYDAQGNQTQVTDPMGNKKVSGYDQVGRVTQITDAGNHTTQFMYNKDNLLTQITDAKGEKTIYAIDQDGNTVAVTDTGGHTISYSFDTMNNLVKVTDQTNGNTSFAYDELNNKTKMTDAKGHVATYSYDDNNQLTAMTDPLGRSTSWQYDPTGNILKQIAANNQVATYQYDKLNRISQVTFADSKTASYSFDQNGNLINLTDWTGKTSFVYDSLNRLTSVSSPDGKTIAYAYDILGNRTQITYPGNKAVHYVFDADNRLASLKTWQGKQTSYTYGVNGNVAKVTLPNGITSNYTYDELDRIAALVHQQGRDKLASYTYQYDSSGNYQNISESVNGENRALSLPYTYDAASRLTFDPRSQYQYDLAGNILSKVTNSQNRDDNINSQNNSDNDSDNSNPSIPKGTTNFTYDVADQLLSDSTYQYQYDTLGNLVKKTGKDQQTGFEYNAQNMLSQVTTGKQKDAKTVQFSYNSLGNRVQKSVQSGDDSLLSKIKCTFFCTKDTTSYVYDINNSLPVILQETTGKQTNSYVYGYGLTSAVTDDKDVYYLPDGLGNVRELADRSGHIVSYTYDSFGKLIKESGESDNNNHFLFQGQYFDEETGLYYMRARYYDPNIGRFISKDPFLGYDIQPSTLNGYTYALDNPLLYEDQSGLYAVGVCRSVSGGTYGRYYSVSQCLVIIDKLEIGFTGTGSKGISTPQASVSLLQLYVNPGTKTISELGGYGKTIGGSIKKGLLNFGLDFSYDPNQNKPPNSLTITFPFFSAGTNPLPGEVHVTKDATVTFSLTNYVSNLVSNFTKAFSSTTELSHPSLDSGK